MISLDKIREDLKDIRYYYARKKIFDSVSSDIGLSKVRDTVNLYNRTILMAPARLFAWVRLKEQRYAKHGDSNLQLYNYDTERYGITYENGLTRSDLFDVLETYAQAYFIYVMQSSLIISNYSIRTNNRFLDAGNFPVWSFDFFRFDYGKGSRYAHILDFDVLRLGKKVVENNPKAGSFEFGVVAITEVGKERGNNLELKEVKKGQDETNQKNDLFNAWLKMCRHSATVDHFPFVKVFTDEQRPESWGPTPVTFATSFISCPPANKGLPCRSLRLRKWCRSLHTENTFRKRLSVCFNRFCSRKGWKYAGVWERSPKTGRLHFHGIFYIPEGTMPGILYEKEDYNFNTHRRQVTIQNTYFNERFGRCDIEPINDRTEMGSAMAYIMKYIEKSGEKIVYSRGLPQYFISDILDDDVVCPFGMEDQKLLLFDNFSCFEDGVYIGEVSPEVIKQMKKAN